MTINIREALKSNGGYIPHDNITAFVEEFGADFPVVIKPYKGDRYLVDAGDVKILPQDNIREIFISARDYDMLFGDEIY